MRANCVVVDQTNVDTKYRIPLSNRRSATTAAQIRTAAVALVASTTPFASGNVMLNAYDAAGTVVVPATVYTAWTSGAAVTIGALRIFKGVLYRCIQAHTTQIDWTPPIVPALWREMSRPGTIGPWKQPAGAHDAYAIGDRCTFEGATWESVIAANVWSPTGYPAGWTQVAL